MCLTLKRGSNLTPPLKWAGGKRWLLPHLEPLWVRAASPRLVEPFCGGLAVALGLRAERALLNDVNTHLINFYRWLQRGLVVRLPLVNDKEVYYAYRARFNQLIKDPHTAASQQAAELFYYLNRTGYNGLCRFNKKGEFNVPFGRYKRINYVRDFRDYRLPLQNWQFTAGDLGIWRCGPTILSTPIPPMMWNLPSTPRTVSAGRIRCAWPGGLRSTQGPWWLPIRPQRALCSSTRIWDLN